jgi:hypothetical protein
MLKEIPKFYFRVLFFLVFVPPFDGVRFDDGDDGVRFDDGDDGVRFDDGVDGVRITDGIDGIVGVLSTELL